MRITVAAKVLESSSVSVGTKEIPQVRRTIGDVTLAGPENEGDCVRAPEWPSAGQVASQPPHPG